MNTDAVLLALVMAVSPMAVLASVLLLTTDHGRAKAGAYALGWVVAVGLVGAATLVAISSVDAAPGSSASTASAALDVVLGVVLLVVALRRRSNERRAGSSSDPGSSGAASSDPAWMGRLDRMSPFVALGFGLFMPPYVIAVAGANSIFRDHGSGLQSADVAAVVVFTVVASLGVLVPWTMAVTWSGADPVIARWRGWLLANWRSVLFWLLVVLGAVLVVKGAVELVAA